MQEKYGTKIAALVREVKLMCLRKNLDGDSEPQKGLVFSTWEEVLAIAERALIDSGVQTVRLVNGSSQSRSEALHRFKSDPRVDVLLLPLKHGANGLNLVEVCCHAMLVLRHRTSCHVLPMCRQTKCFSLNLFSMLAKNFKR